MSLLFYTLFSSLALVVFYLDLAFCKSHRQWGTPLVYRTVVVDHSRHGDFSTVQSAIDSIHNGNRNWVCIFIKAAVYRERVEIPKEKQFIYLKGEGKGATIIERDGHDPFIQWSSTFATWAENVCVQSIGFMNSYNFPVGQIKNSRRPAVAAMVAGDKTVFYDCGFYGLQDTLWDFQGRHYFRGCTIVGAVDFIFGNGQSIYERCTIVAKAKTLGAGIIGYITAQGRTGPDKTDGFVFKGCNVVGDGQSFLGRPWRTYARVIFFNTTMSNIVVPQGWSLGNYASHIDKVTFVEYESHGLGSNPSRRVKWASKISKSAAETFTNLDYINGDRWITYIPR